METSSRSTRASLTRSWRASPRTSNPRRSRRRKMPARRAGVAHRRDVKAPLAPYLARDIDLGQHPHGERMNRLRIAAGAEALDFTGSARQAFGHLAPARVARTQEEHTNRWGVHCFTSELLSLRVCALLTGRSPVP